MADDDRHDDAELASAYLDGEVTAAERARVEADAGLFAEVDRLRRVRDAFADVPPAPAKGREAAIAAALAAFDAHTEVMPPAAPNVVPLDSRRRARRMQVLTAAAAVLVVAGGFVVATRGGGDGDGGNADVQRDQVAASAPAEAPTTTAVASTVELATTTTGAPAGATLDAESAASVAELDQTMAAAPAAPAAEEGAMAPLLPAVGGAAELADLAATLEAAPPPLDDVVDACRDGDAIPTAQYVDERGAALDVALADDDGEIVAVSVDDCTVVLRAGT
jgi:hypothetical protein